MKLTFQIEYYTQWGEEVRVLFADGQSFPLQTQDGHIWRGDLTFNPLQIAAEIAYRYAIYRGDTCIRKEWAGVKRRLMVNLGYTHFILHDGWRDRPEDAYLYSSAFSGEGELMRIAVLPEYRGRGYSRKLMERLEESARAAGAQELTLEVRESNEAALHLYKSCGFRVEAVRKDYYRNPKENALILWKRGFLGIPT